MEEIKSKLAVQEMREKEILAAMDAIKISSTQSDYAQKRVHMTLNGKRIWMTSPTP